MAIMAQAAEEKTTFWKNGKEYELVAPEGGWGFMIGLSLVIIFIACTSTMSCFGLIYNDFLQEIGEGTRGITLLHGVFSISLSLSGFLTSTALRKFTMRQVGFFGCTLFSCGSLLLVFVRSVNDMLIASGLMQASGFGIMIPIIYTSFNHYFSRLRVPVLSVCKVVVGCSTMVAPLLVKISMQEFGFRGTLLLLGGLALHAFIAICLIQPIELHRVPKEVEFTQRKDSILGSTELLHRAADDIHNKPRGSIISAKFVTEQMTKTIHEHVEVGTDDGDTPNITLNDQRAYEAVPDDEYDNMQNLVRATSIMSLGNWNNSIMEPLPPVVDKKGKLREIVSFLDLSLFLDPSYTNMCLGMSISIFSDITYFMLLPLMLYQQGWNNSQVAISISIAGGGDLLCRIILAIVSRYNKINGRQGFLLGLIGTLVLRTALQFSTDYRVTLVIIGLMGALRCLMHVLNTIVIAESLPLSRYPAGLGLYMLVYGLFNLCLGPIVGIIRDVTQSYWAAFYMLNSAMLLCIISWSFEFYFIRNKTSKVKEVNNRSRST